MSKKCSVEGCENKHCAKGYCKKHYEQMRLYGCITDNKPKPTNEIIDCIDHAEIVLCNKHGEEVARSIIDSEYIDIIAKHKWHLTADGYVCNRKVGYLHRFIINPSEDLVVDHINRDRLDNRRCNLRICTDQQNSFNQSIRCTNTSGASGVWYDKRTSKWAAEIMINGKKKWLGRFKTKEEAIQARQQAEIDYFGEYRRQE